MVFAKSGALEVSACLRLLIAGLLFVVICGHNLKTYKSVQKYLTDIMETPQEEIARLQAENMGLKRLRDEDPNRVDIKEIRGEIAANTNAITALRTQLGMFSPPFPVVYPYNSRRPFRYRIFAVPFPL